MPSPKRKKAPVTIQDVSRAAKVSATTVSHALNGRGRVSKETRDRIHKVVEEIGYTANPVARALKSGRSMVLVVELPATAEAAGLDSAFLRDVLVGAAEKAIGAGYLMGITIRSGPRPESLPIHDGRLVVDPLESETPAQIKARQETPLVSVARFATQPEDIPAVDTDYMNGVREILDHLVESGYVRPGLLTTDLPYSFATACAAGYESWCDDRGVEPLIEAIADFPSIDNGHAATRELLASRDVPDSIVAVTEPLAIGAMRALAEEGLKVPNEFGVACAHDSDRLRSARIPVTALEVHPLAIGRGAVDILIEMIEADSKPEVPRLTEIPSSLNERESTSRPEPGG